MKIQNQATVKRQVPCLQRPYSPVAVRYSHVTFHVDLGSSYCSDSGAEEALVGGWKSWGRGRDGAGLREGGFGHSDGLGEGWNIGGDGETAGCVTACEDPASWHGESDDLLAVSLSKPPSCERTSLIY